MGPGTSIAVLDIIEAFEDLGSYAKIGDVNRYMFDVMWQGVLWPPYSSRSSFNNTQVDPMIRTAVRLK